MPTSAAKSLARSLLVGLIVAATALIAFLPLFYAGNDSVESTTDDVRKGIIERSADNVNAFFRRARESANSVSRATENGLLDFENMYATHPPQRLANFLHGTLTASRGTINNAYVKTTIDHGCWQMTAADRDDYGKNTIVVVRRLNCTDWALEVHNVLSPSAVLFNRTEATIRFPFIRPPLDQGDAQALQAPFWYEPLFVAGTVSLDYALPIYNTTGGVVGVFGVAAVTRDLSTFLSTIGLRDGGRAMVVESPNGTMIANSWNQPNAIQTGQGRNGEQVGDLVDFQNITDALMRRVIEHYGRTQILTGAVPFAATMGKGRDRTYVDVLGVTDAYGLNLRILVAMPLEDFLGDFNRATTTVIAVIVPIVALILLLAVAVAAMSQYALLRRNKLAPKAAPLTLMFTDIEGSTTLWNQSPEAMGKAIDIHHRTIREVIAAHGAYEVKTVGDAFMIATESALTATTLALDIQSELAKQQWPGELTADAGSREWNGVRVRIGVHRCVEVEAKYEEDKHYWDYYGNDVNIAARVESKAQGGQTLLSEATWEAVQADPQFEAMIGTASASLYARGVTLKGVEGTVSLFSVVPMELAARTFHPLEGHEKDADNASSFGGSETASSIANSSIDGAEFTTRSVNGVIYSLFQQMSHEGREKLVSMILRELKLPPNRSQRKAMAAIGTEMCKRMRVQPKSRRRSSISRNENSVDAAVGGGDLFITPGEDAHPNMVPESNDGKAANKYKEENDAN